MIKIKTPVPGNKSAKILNELKRKDGSNSARYPFVHSGKGKGAFTEDIDGNVFLDFASQIASNPLGYNHSKLLEIVSSFKRHPVKMAGADFAISETLDMIKSILSVSPSNFDSAFLINSGAEAVENAIKICMRKRDETKFGISVEGAFHGRTLGALSLTNSKAVHKQGYLRLPMLRLPFGDDAVDELERIISQEGKAEEIGFVILEHFQGEGGYRIPSEKMIRGLRRLTKKNGIPYIADEVQAGMGRTGKWWAFEHYGVKPEVFSSAKALQVGAVVSSKKMFPDESGAISSTWGGGHILDMALGIETINIIKKEKLLFKNENNGKYLLKRLHEISGISNVRGRGLMIAFDLENSEIREKVILECVKNGLLILGAGEKSIRVIPPYVIGKREIDEGIEVIENAVRVCSKKSFRHKGKICEFMNCGEIVS